MTFIDGIISNINYVNIQIFVFAIRSLEKDIMTMLEVKKHTIKGDVLWFSVHQGALRLTWLFN